MGQTDGQTDGRTDRRMGRTGVTLNALLLFFEIGGGIKMFQMALLLLKENSFAILF